jgi:hypothetical protein
MPQYTYIIEMFLDKPVIMTSGRSDPEKEQVKKIKDQE